MTREELTEVIIDRLANGDCPQEIKGKYHPEIVDAHIGMALDYLISKVMYPEAERAGDWGMLDAYAKPFTNVEILYDAERNEKYSNLPVQPVSLPKNRGVRLISAMRDQKYRFIYRDNNSNNIFGNLDVEDVILEPRFYVEGGRKAFYDGHLPINMDKVLMKLIVPFDQLDYEDDVTIPQGYGKLLFDMVFQSLAGIGLEKVSNDNNANIP